MSSKKKSAILIVYENFVFGVDFIETFCVSLRLSILMSLTGTLLATFFSSSNVFAFFAIKREFSGIAIIST